MNYRDLLNLQKLVGEKLSEPMSDTPRTDAWEQTSAPYADLINLARQLEMELNETISGEVALTTEMGVLRDALVMIERATSMIEVQAVFDELRAARFEAEGKH